MKDEKSLAVSSCSSFCLHPTSFAFRPSPYPSRPGYGREGTSGALFLALAARRFLSALAGAAAFLPALFAAALVGFLAAAGAALLAAAAFLVHRRPGAALGFLLRRAALL